MSTDPSTSLTVVSRAALLRMLREQGVTDLNALVQKGLDGAKAIEEKEDSPHVFEFVITTHYVYVYGEPAHADASGGAGAEPSY